MIVAGISCVSAENIDDIDQVSASDVDVVISTDESLDDTVSVEENEVLSSSSTTVYNWTELDSAVSTNSGDDTVYIGASLTPSSQIAINHNVTIIGSTNTYVGGSSSSNKVTYSDIPFYSDASGLSITLKNIKFQNCGGNILIKFAGNGNYILDNCTFENITAAGTKQVVVHLSYGNCNITDCTFEKCTTSYGAVSNYKSDSEPDAVHMVVRNTTFKNNSASVEPGCINNCGHLIVYDSTFEENSAGWWAGAIHTHSNANATIIRSNFIRNVAGWNGGALSTYSYLKVINSTFIGNNATTNNGGGAIYALSRGSAPYVVVENSDFDNNTAFAGNGGAIVVIYGTLIVDNSRFNNNVANATNGGAISSGISTTTITNCNFTGNNATSGKGGAIFAGGAGHLNVHYCLFINNTALNNESGYALAYYYTGSKTTLAYLNYTNNRFNETVNCSVYAANSNLNVFEENNNFSDYSSYVEPVIGGDVVTIPEDAELGTIVWNVTFEDEEDILNGTPLIVDDYILIPAGHSLYCYYTNGTYVWNVSAYPGYFRELLVENGIVYAPCSGDKLYVLDLETGDSLTNTTIIQGSSIYAPVMYNNTLYIASEYGYGSNNNTWITMVKYVDGDYVYYGSILELNNVSYGTQALLSEPIIYGDYLYINTIYGLIRYNLLDNTMINITDTVGNPVIDSNGNICVLRNISGSTYLCLLDSSLNVVDSELLGGTCSMLTSDGNGNVYTVDSDGYIYITEYSGSSLSFEVTTFNINPVSSAMYCDEDYIYIGDDAGILWVFYLFESTLSESLFLAYNTTCPIVGGIAVDEDDVIYIGTNNGNFYAIES